MIRDVQIRMNAEGRTYVIEICAPGVNSAPVAAGPFDVHIAVGVAGILPEWRGVEAERVVREVVDDVRPLVPVSVTPGQWSRFADVPLAWVCAHVEATA